MLRKMSRNHERERRMNQKEPRDGLGFDIKFKIGKDKYHVSGEGKREFQEVIEEIEVVQHQAREKAEDKKMLKRILRERQE